jgi:anti-anti-sigma factor
MLAEFAGIVTSLIGTGQRRVLIDLAPVTYVDSATIGCLLDLYRQISADGGTLKLSSVQKRVETMMTMTGTQNFIQIYPDETRALASFEA